MNFMRPLLFILILSVIPFFVKSQTNSVTSNKLDTTKKTLIVEVACGQCQFHLPGKGCDLAVRIEGHAYFVSGANIDSYGDAHAKDGFCNSSRIAKVQGELIDERFKLSYLELLKN